MTDLNIPMSSYATLAKPPLVFDERNAKFVPATLEGVPIPPLAAPVASFKYTWKLLKDSFKLQRTGNNSFAFQLEQAIQFFLDHKAYSTHIADKNNLEIIIRGDGFPVGGKHAIFLIVTLGNFGPLGKCIGFNLPINVAEVDESNLEEVRAALQGNLKTAGEMSQKTKWQFAAGFEPNVRVEYGGDEAWLRMLMGIRSSKEQFACLKCLWLRGTLYDPETRVDRLMDFMHHFATDGEIDQRAVPLFCNVRIEQLVAPMWNACNYCIWQRFAAVLLPPPSEAEST